jgi:hypothetical protein
MFNPTKTTRNHLMRNRRKFGCCDVATLSFYQSFLGHKISFWILVQALAQEFFLLSQQVKIDPTSLLFYHYIHHHES